MRKRATGPDRKQRPPVTHPRGSPSDDQLEDLQQAVGNRALTELLDGEPPSREATAAIAPLVDAAPVRQPARAEQPAARGVLSRMWSGVVGATETAVTVMRQSRPKGRSCGSRPAPTFEEVETAVKRADQVLDAGILATTDRAALKRLEKAQGHIRKVQGNLGKIRKALDLKEKVEQIDDLLMGLAYLEGLEDHDAGVADTAEAYGAVLVAAGVLIEDIPLVSYLGSALQSLGSGFARTAMDLTPQGSPGRPSRRFLDKDGHLIIDR